MFDNIYQQDYTIKWSNLTKQNLVELLQKGTITMMLISHAEKKKKNQMEITQQNVKISTTPW